MSPGCLWDEFGSILVRKLSGGLIFCSKFINRVNSDRPALLYDWEPDFLTQKWDLTQTDTLKPHLTLRRGDLDELRWIIVRKRRKSLIFLLPVHKPGGFWPTCITLYDKKQDNLTQKWDLERKNIILRSELVFSTSSGLYMYGNEVCAWFFRYQFIKRVDSDRPASLYDWMQDFLTQKWDLTRKKLISHSEGVNLTSSGQ